jgi:hypothetical protein
MEAMNLSTDGNLADSVPKNASVSKSGTKSGFISGLFGGEKSKKLSGYDNDISRTGINNKLLSTRTQAKGGFDLFGIFGKKTTAAEPMMPDLTDHYG